MSPPPEKYTFFVDRCLGSRKVVQALLAAGLKAEAHDDHFPPDYLDQDWLVDVSARGWVVLTQDRNIRRRKPELEALLESKAAAFIITTASITGDEAAALVLKSVNKMVQLLDKYNRPLLIELTRSGDIRILEGEKRGGVRKGTKEK